jgi:hypothetical protein
MKGQIRVAARNRLILNKCRSIWSAPLMNLGRFAIPESVALA